MDITKRLEKEINSCVMLGWFSNRHIYQDSLDEIQYLRKKINILEKTVERLTWSLEEKD